MNLKGSPMKKLLTLSLILVLLFTSCAGGKSVMRFGGASINEGEFTYYLATYKARFASTYSDFKDNAAFYSQIIGEKTAGEYLFDEVVHNVSMTLVCDALFSEYRLSLADSVQREVDEYVASFLDNSADGNKNVLNQALGVYGVNMKMWKEILLRDARASALFDYLYGSSGTVGVNDDDRAAYLAENYVHVRHIYVNDKYTYEIDANGDPVYGSDGYQNKVPLSPDALAAKKAVVDAIDESLAEGGDFEEIYEAFSEDKYYKNGYYITRDMNFVSGIVTSAFDLEIGKWIKLESDVGTHYIMRLPLGEKPWKDESCADFFDGFDTAVAAECFTAMIEARLGEIEYDSDLLETFSLEDSPMNSRFQ